MFNVDATLLRILLVVITIFTSGTVILIYIIAGLLVPKEPPIYSNFGPNGLGDGYGGGYNSGYGNQSFGGPYKNPPTSQGGWNNQQPNAAPTSTQFDSMMDDLEKKALRREIEELKNKISKYEKGE
ncbi:PspC domain protein [compost metagenome]